VSGQTPVDAIIQLTILHMTAGTSMQANLTILQSTVVVRFWE